MPRSRACCGSCRFCWVRRSSCRFRWSRRSVHPGSAPAGSPTAPAGAAPAGAAGSSTTGRASWASWSPCPCSFGIHRWASPGKSRNRRDHRPRRRPPKARRPPNGQTVPTRARGWVHIPLPPPLPPAPTTKFASPSLGPPGTLPLPLGLLLPQRNYMRPAAAPRQAPIRKTPPPLGSPPLLSRCQPTGPPPVDAGGGLLLLLLLLKGSPSKGRFRLLLLLLLLEGSPSKGAACTAVPPPPWPPARGGGGAPAATPSPVAPSWPSPVKLRPLRLPPVLPEVLLLLLLIFIGASLQALLTPLSRLGVERNYEFKLLLREGPSSRLRRAGTRRTRL